MLRWLYQIAMLQPQAEVMSTRYKVG
jgi:hypothetical protein